MALDIDLARLAATGQSVSAPEAANILREAREAQSAFQARVSTSGIPAELAVLLAATKKSEAQSISKNLTIGENHLFRLINNCSQLGYTCRSRFPQFVPEHLEITDEDRKHIRLGTLRKFSRKVISLFESRKNIHVHLLQRKREWHCFYFNYSDIDVNGENHWVNGPHLHYVSHLWPKLDIERVWEAFDKRRTWFSGSLHIRFIPFDYSESTGMSWRSGEGAIYTMFPSDLSLLEGTQPTPPAQITTRGSWSATIYIPMSV